jgi:hypothetical protein
MPTKFSEPGTLNAMVHQLIQNDRNGNRIAAMQREHNAVTLAHAALSDAMAAQYNAERLAPFAIQVLAEELVLQVGKGRYASIDLDGDERFGSIVTLTYRYGPRASKVGVMAATLSLPDVGLNTCYIGAPCEYDSRPGFLHTHVMVDQLATAVTGIVLKPVVGEYKKAS